jgi:hypothetical protein
MKNIIKEQSEDLYKKQQTKLCSQVIDPFLNQACVADCYRRGFVPNVPVPDFPELNAIQEVAEEDGKKMFAFHTSVDSKKIPGRKMTYLYTGTPENYTFVKAVAYRCEKLEKLKNPTNLTGYAKSLYDFVTKPVSENGLGYRGVSDVNDSEIGDWELVNLNTDKDIKEGGLYWDKIKGVASWIETINNQLINIYAYKPRKGTASVFDITNKKKEVYEYFKSKDYTQCAQGDFEDGTVAKVDLYKIYGSTFEQGTFVCKPWTKISTSKSDCITAIDSYYELIQQYSNVEGNIPVEKRDLVMMKNQVNKCMAEWYNEKGFKSLGRRNKMEFLKSLRASSPFFLRESTDRLTNIIRESLSIVKMRKNSI